MKKLMLLCYLLIGSAVASFAQSTVKSGAPVEKAKELKTKLDLTDAQTMKISAIYKESAQKFEAIKKKEKGDNVKMTKALKPVKANTINRIKAQLTKTQAGKFDEMLKQDAGSNDGWSTGWSASS